MSATGLVVALASCGHRDAPAVDPSRGDPPAAEVAELEIRGSGIDRFTTCPPPGDLGQHWIPPLPAWAPPPATDAGPPLPVDQDFIARTKDRTLTEIAVDATHKEFRSCYLATLVRHPTQDGRVAIVLRIGADGRLAKVESYGACELAPEAISCMYGVAKRLRFPPTPAGETVTIPATFTSRDGVRRTVPTGNDGFAAAAFVTLEGARPALHACEEEARRDGRSVEASATYALAIAGDGRVVKADLSLSNGDATLLRCGSRALSALRFTPRSGGFGESWATVSTRLNFNPRQGTR